MKKARFCFLFAVLAAGLLMLAAASAEYSFVSSCPPSFRMEGSVADRNGAALYSAPDTSEKGIPLNRGDTFTVTGETGRFYRVVSDGETGYIPKKNIALTGIPQETAVRETVSGSFALEDPLPRRDRQQPVTFSGELSFPAPADSLLLFLWDERSFSLEKSFSFQMIEPSDKLDGSALNSLINVSRVKAGRKTLVIQGYADGEPFVAARLVFAVRGRAEEPLHVTDRCSLSVQGVLADSSIYSGWLADAREPSLTVGIPEDVDAALLTLEWKTPPDSFTAEYSDRDGNLLFSETRSTGFYLDSLALDGRIASVRITPSGKNCVLCTARVYPERYAEFAVQNWESLPEKVDLMLFSAHEDDELLFFGGTIPYYSAAGKSVAVVYMTDCGRARYREALDGLWTAGLKYHPVFLGWQNGTVEMNAGLEAALGIWARENTPDPLQYLVRLIRTYRPDVVVTHDFNGEYRHMQHRLTAMLIGQAAVLSGDPDYDPEGGLPVWEVKKLYIHLYEENQVVMDWDRPLDGENKVFTPRFLATEAYDKHQSQQKYFTMEKEGILYDNRCFGLYYSTVGEDILKNDLFENIP